MTNKKGNNWVGKEFYYAPYDITDMAEDKGFKPGEKVIVLEEVGDPMHKFVYVRGSNNKVASVSKKSLSKEYPTSLVTLMGMAIVPKRKEHKKFVTV
jgi:hypothetical protein